MSSSLLRRFIAIIALVTATLPLWAAQTSSPPPVRLVVVISVDQMRADYLDRFKNLYRGGLRRLQREGAVMADGHQNHADTETGPGHSTLLSGRVPGHNGIISNDWYDRAANKIIYCVSTTKHNLLGVNRLGASPELLKTTTLGDWLKSQSPQSKVISLSRKDRSAVLMGGQHPDQDYWFDTTEGQFVTSTYYAAQYPAWFEQWRKLGVVDSYLGKSWDRLESNKRIYSLSDPDAAPGQGVIGTAKFPHKLDSTTGKPDTTFYNFLIATPFFDEITLKFAETVLQNERLGQRGTTDLLAIGLSSTDYIGHNMGPHSQEIQDQMLRLDARLGEFLEYLDAVLGSKNYWVVLSADHGIMPLPENQRVRQHNARRVGLALARMTEDLEKHLQAQLGPGKWIADGPSNGGYYFSSETIARHGITLEKVAQTAIQFLKKQPLVVEHYTRRELESTAVTKDKFLERFRNSYDPTRSGDLQIRLPEYALASTRPTGTTHGSPYDYDSHVPIVFLGEAFKFGRHTKRANTVDIAPTLARALGIAPPTGLDGRVLTEILKKKE